MEAAPIRLLAKGLQPLALKSHRFDLHGRVCWTGRGGRRPSPHPTAGLAGPAASPGTRQCAGTVLCPGSAHHSSARERARHSIP